MIEYENLSKVNAIYLPEFFEKITEIASKGQYILGQEVLKFEENFAAYCGTRYCVGTGNGLDALILSLKALELPNNAEVIVPANTYIASVLAVIHAGLKPVLVDAELDTYNINPDLIEEKIGPNTRAILVVHLYGNPCKMDQISAVCRRNNLSLIEDCAQAHGASYRGKRVGSWGICGAFSFYPTKILGALGDGGCVTTDNFNIYKKLLALRNYGATTKNVHQLIGHNSRLDEMQAAFLNIKLRDIESIINQKQKLAKIYKKHLSKHLIFHPELPDEVQTVIHILPTRHANREKIREDLSNYGIETQVHYPTPLYSQIALSHLFIGEEYPISDLIHKTVFSLPISSSLDEEELEEALFKYKAASM